MCGLVGIAGSNSANMDKAFRVLLVLDTIRGEHSTGALIVGSAGSIDIHKKVGNPFELFDSKGFDVDIRYCNNVLLGHNRYATAGSVTKRNAHPFDHDTIIGAHNGTLTTQWKLDDYKDYAVDSDNLYHHLAVNGVQATTPLLGGAYALTWWDTTTNTLNFLRNKERPLCYAFTKDRLNILWASERWMLQVAADKALIKLGNIHSLPVAKHYSLQIPLGSSKGYPILGNFQIEGVQEYTPPKPSHVVIGPNSTTRGGTNTITSNSPNYLGRYTLDFTVVSMQDGGNNVIVCKLLDYPDTRAQFICRGGSVEAKEYIANTGQIYQAQIKRVIRKSSTALVILNKKSIQEVVFQPEEEDTTGDSPFSVLSINGVNATEAQFMSATAEGCVCCGDKPTYNESGELFWVNDNTFVCAYCMEDERIKEHYGVDEVPTYPF